jgi:hypothetical protein
VKVTQWRAARIVLQTSPKARGLVSFFARFSRKSARQRAFVPRKAEKLRQLRETTKKRERKEKKTEKKKRQTQPKQPTTRDHANSMPTHMPENVSFRARLGFFVALCARLCAVSNLCLYCAYKRSFGIEVILIQGRRAARRAQRERGKEGKHRKREVSIRGKRRQVRTPDHTARHRMACKDEGPGSKGGGTK